MAEVPSRFSKGRHAFQPVEMSVAALKGLQQQGQQRMRTFAAETLTGVPEVVILGLNRCVYKSFLPRPTQAPVAQAGRFPLRDLADRPGTGDIVERI